MPAEYQVVATKALTGLTIRPSPRPSARYWDKLSPNRTPDDRKLQSTDLGGNHGRVRNGAFLKTSRSGCYLSPRLLGRKQGAQPPHTIGDFPYRCPAKT